MANAQQLLDEACTSGIACLEPGQQSIAIAQALASFLGMNARELLDAACESGIDCLEPGQLVTVTAEGIRQIASAGGGGGGDCCSSGVGSPEGVVTGNPGKTYLDTSTDDFWIKETGVGTNTGWIPLIVT